MTHQEYISLVNEAKKHSYLYYVESNPAISDAEFDAMLDEIGRYEQSHPDQILPDSPTQCVGSDLNGNGRRLVAHRSPMLSQQKAHNIDDIKAFMASIKSVLGYAPSMRVEWKYDGVSCSIVYIDGQLVSAATRGDGQRGQDITDHVKAMPSVPSVINQSGRVEVRGEVVCPKDQHVALGYKDERTAASAILNTAYSDSAKTLCFLPWEVIGESYNKFSDVNTLSASFVALVNGYNVNGIRSIEDAINRLSANRLANYPVDGLVIKIDDYSDFQRMGANQHHPKGSIAYKFEAASAVTTVLDIEIKVAKSRRITPVAHIAPVTIKGKNITKINLFSEKTMNDMGVVVGSSVKVVLHNDVTPKIVAVVDGYDSVDTDDETITINNAPIAAPKPKRTYIPKSEPEDIIPSDYWDKEVDKQNEKKIRMFDDWKNRKNDHFTTVPLSTNPIYVPQIGSYMPSREDVENLEREERLRSEEENKRSDLSKKFNFIAALGAVAAVIFLCVFGVGIAAFIAPLLAGAFFK